jgi:hypothetical protein
MGPNGFNAIRQHYRGHCAKHIPESKAAYGKESEQPIPLDVKSI